LASQLLPAESCSSGTAPDGSTALYTINIDVPVVRPDHETTAFLGFNGYGDREQTLVPRSSDPTVDFSGKTAKEFAAGQAGPDMCCFRGSDRLPLDKITSRPDQF
jgi:hypothetical protein